MIDMYILTLLYNQRYSKDFDVFMQCTSIPCKERTIGVRCVLVGKFFREKKSVNTWAKVAYVCKVLVQGPVNIAGEKRVCEAA